MAKKILIALDDGHGISTSGKRTPTLPNGQKSEIGLPYMNENLFNRAVVRYLKEELERNDFAILEVAPTDTDTPLATRTTLANSRGANLYISIHANASTGVFGNHGGIETFHAGKGESLKLASAIHQELLKGTPLSDRGLKDGSHLWVIRKTNMVSVLLELGFMDSHKDYKYLLSDAYRRECAREICIGICKYYNRKYKEEAKTASAAPATHKPLLLKGSKGEVVKELQTLLNKKGASLKVDGDFGTATYQAVLKFQKAHKLTTDGIVGHKTWETLSK